jgi:two-component system sensor histidine kinase CpxA
MRKGGIFLQTFIWFWIIMTAVVALLHTIHEMTETTSEETHVRKIVRAPLTFFAEIAVDRYERSDTKGLADAINLLKSSAGIDVFFLNEGGSEVSGRPAPPEALALAAQAGNDGKLVVTLSHEEDYAAMRIVGTKGQYYTVVGVIPEMIYRGMSREILLWIVWLIVVLLVSSIACYFLSRYMTSPILKLRKAAKRLASGDLTVRVAPAVGTRGDEIGELARDFDVMAERVEALLTAQQQLLGNISHELRSPLSRIGVALELAERHSTTPEAGKYLGRIELEAERLNELIGMLLTFTRLESGLGDIKKEFFDLAEVVEEIAANADFEGRGSGKAVRVTESVQCIISGTKELIYSAVENVVRNAVRYTVKGTEVKIALHRIGDAAAPTAVITVCDHGPGVPEDHLKKLFRPFYRVSEGRERQTGGTGLGLAITKRAILLHGGSVKATNAPDGGLIVEIVLPMVVHV